MNQASSDVQHIWVVTGPAGCGKSTVGRALQAELGVPFLEGDDVSFPYLSKANYQWGLLPCILLY